MLLPQSLERQGPEIIDLLGDVFHLIEKVENETIYQKNQDLMDIKCKIDTCDSKKWEEVKKKYNLYEYIYTISFLIKFLVLPGRGNHPGTIYIYIYIWSAAYT